MARLWPWKRESVPAALTAAAVVVQGPGTQQSDPGSPSRNLQRVPDEWQRECWDFYDSLGEFRQGVTWKSNMLSRVRLRAAKRVPNQDEPKIVDSGVAHDLVMELGGGAGGQSQLMSSFTVNLEVPGECYLVGETKGVKADGTPNNVWCVRSLEEVRLTIGGQYEIADANTATKWRVLPANSFVVRVYRPHKRWHNVADSPARAARPLMRELELINRHIASQYMSRLASAGVVVFPDEITFPVRPEFADAPDPFIAEWIEIAAEAIKTPGTASSVIPIPIRVPGEYVDKVKLIDFTLKLDDQIIAKRDSGLSRLAIELDMPAEALLGTSNVNHWNAWLIDEQGVKIHVAPTAEIICDALTVGYLTPRLEAAGEDPSEWVVWYDASELVLRTDRSESARELYDRVEINGVALRRENGFDESDAPTDSERQRIILTKASLQPVNTFAALDELGFETDHDTPVNEPRPEAQTPPEQAPPVEPGPPDQPDPAGPTPKSKNTAGLTETLTRQAQLMHGLKVDLIEGITLLHPLECMKHLAGCPVTHATWRPPISAMPGTSGVYRCWLNEHGTPIIGQRLYNGEASQLIPGPRPGDVRPVAVESS
jgi:hypothetical protein